MVDPSPWLTPRQQRVWRAWMSLRSSLPNALNRQLAAASGLSLSDYETMVCLSEADESTLRVSDLAAVLGWERSRLSHQLRRMHARGLLDRRACPTDGRVTFVTLTEKGFETLRSAAPGHAQIVRELLFDDLSEAELATLEGFFARAEQRLAPADQPDQAC